MRKGIVIVGAILLFLMPSFYTGMVALDAWDSSGRMGVSISEIIDQQMLANIILVLIATTILAAGLMMKDRGPYGPKLPRPCHTVLLESDALLDRGKCPNCGRPIKPGTVTCLNCYCPVTKRYCGHCGVRVPVGIEICPHCSQRL
jgi:hypothetical protein